MVTLRSVLRRRSRWVALFQRRIAFVEQFLMNILFEFLAAGEKARDKAELVGAVERVTCHLGMNHFAMAFLPLAHERLDSYFVWERWPRGWFERYLALNYFHADPVAHYVRQTGQPAVWSKALDNRVLSSKARKIMSEAGEFGLVDGLTIPLYSRVGVNGLFSVAGTREPMEPLEVQLFSIVASTAHARLLGWTAPSHCVLPEIFITKRESEFLSLCAAGKTDREIGEFTGRSQRTVQAHIRNLQKKLSAVNRAQLIAEAFRQGWQR